MNAIHQPVLVREVIEFLRIRPERVYVDATVGTGGHALEIARRLTTGKLVCIDKDPRALEIAQERLRPHQRNVVLVHSSYTRIAEIREGLGLGKVDGVLADLGVSSLQLEAPERGFSFSRSGPLDMRMDTDQARTAANIINQWDEERLAELFYRFGEERHSYKIARAIVRARPLRDTTHLATVVAGAQRAKGRQKLHPATKTFLALRIAVNRELEELEQFLTRAPATLLPGGRILVLSYHSLEDRIVKQKFRELAEAGTLRLVTRKVVRPRPAEIRENPRARSARMRVAEKRAEPNKPVAIIL